MCARLKEDIRFYKKKIVINRKNLQISNFNIKTMKSQTQNLHTETGNANSLL